jgi:tyrosyl-tRNA synthetase
MRVLQKKLAEEITIMVHSEKDYEMAVSASEILFGKGTAEELKSLDETTFLAVFEGVPQFNISKSEIENGINVVDLLADKTGVFESKGELRRTIQGNGLSINKEKVPNADLKIDNSFLISNKYILAQKGKKNYSLIIVG